jgi:putative alpha-1,2-mannosidase
MRIRCTGWMIGLLWMVSVAMGAQSVPIDWVNVRIGTGSGAIGYGGSMPFVVPPFGMTDWTAQTRQNKLGTVSYKDEDTRISGFMGTHQPAIWMGDYGYVTLMPEVDDLKTSPDARRLAYKHIDETARPDYYSVSMDAGKRRAIRTEMTATDRCALMRFTFPANASSMIVVEASRPGVVGFVEVDSARHEIRGYNPDRMDAGLGPMLLKNFKGYFVVQFSKSFAGSGTYGPSAVERRPETGAYARFATTRGEVIEARVGTSFISVDQARECKATRGRSGRSYGRPANDGVHGAVSRSSVSARVL